MFDSEYFDTNAGDNQVMVTASLSMLKSLFGDENWMRFNKIKRDSGSETLQSLFTWLLELGEERLSESYSYDSAATYSANVSPVIQPLPLQHPIVTRPACRRWQPKTGQKRTLHTTVSRDGDYDIIALPTPTTEAVKVEQSTGHDLSVSTDHDTMFAEGCGSKYHPTSSITKDDVDVLVSADHTSFSCVQCQVSLSDVEVVREHYQLRHTRGGIDCSGVAIRFHCLCSDGSGEQTAFTGIDSYVAHHRSRATLSSDQRGGNQFVCNHCAKTFARQAALSEHVTYKHDKAEPRFQCPACHKLFRYKRSLNRHHMRSHIYN